MNIIIVGAAGQLGTDCCNTLSREHNVICPDIGQLNIGEQQSVDTFIRAHTPDTIINCAAYTAVDACETDTEHCWHINANGPKYLAKAAQKQNCRLIHISTDYVFDGTLPPPAGYTETSTPNPLSEYGKSKLVGEKEVLQYAPDAIILRTAWLYSHHGPNFLKTMLRLTLQNPERPLKVVNDQYGSLTWSRTLSTQIKQLLNTDMKGIIHATSEGHSTWYEAARYFLEAMQVNHNLQPCTTAEYPTPAARPANSILSNTRLNAAQTSTFVDWKEDITIFVENFREQLLAENT